MVDERLTPSSRETHKSNEMLGTVDMRRAQTIFGEVYTRVLADFKRAQEKYNMYHSTGNSPTDYELIRDLEASRHTKDVVEELARGLQIDLNQKNKS